MQNHKGYSQWADGRATFYGTDAWNIHQGSCQYGWLDKNVGTGWDIAAISDVAPDFQNSCGCVARFFGVCVVGVCVGCVCGVTGGRAIEGSGQEGLATRATNSTEELSCHPPPHQVS